MTAKQFYAALAETKYEGWRLMKNGSIRTRVHCPITKVAVRRGAKDVTGARDWDRASRFLGLSELQTDRLMDGADNARMFSGLVRKRLLKILDLKEMVR